MTRRQSLLTDRLLGKPMIFQGTLSNGQIVSVPIHYRIGAFIIHRPLTPGFPTLSWTISHETSAHRLITVRLLKHAIEVAQAFNALPYSWTFDTPDDMPLALRRAGSDLLKRFESWALNKS